MSDCISVAQAVVEPGGLVRFQGGDYTHHLLAECVGQTVFVKPCAGEWNQNGDGKARLIVTLDDGTQFSRLVMAYQKEDRYGHATHK